MANNNSVHPSEKQRKEMEGYDYETLRHIRTLVSIDYVRVTNLIHEGRKEMEEMDRREIEYMEKINGSDDYREELQERYTLDGILSDPLLYGTVMVSDCLGDDIVYHRFNDVGCEHLPLPLPHQISLRGPRRAISGNHMFIISVNFWGVRHHLHANTIKELARGEIVWDSYTRDPSSYDKPLQQDVLGEYGTVTVGYSVIREALSATIDVVWMDDSVPRMYGTVKAVRSLGGSPTTQMLFDVAATADKWGAKEVYPQRSIFYQPLFGTEKFTTFPVPMNSDLTIEVDLWDHSSPDYQSVLGKVQFTPKFGTYETIINGKYGKVQVSVTFN